MNQRVTQEEIQKTLLLLATETKPLYMGMVSVRQGREIADRGQSLVVLLNEKEREPIRAFVVSVGSYLGLKETTKLEAVRQAKIWLHLRYRKEVACMFEWSGTLPRYFNYAKQAAKPQAGETATGTGREGFGIESRVRGTLETAEGRNTGRTSGVPGVPRTSRNGRGSRRQSGEGRE